MTESFIHHSKQILNRSIYWLGGSPCSGKSSIARALSQRHGLRYVACDDFYDPHARAADPTQQPVMHRIARMTWEQIWLRPVEVLVQDEFEAYRELFPLLLADLVNMEDDRPLMVEGAALIPELVAPLIKDPTRAVWVVPSPDFQRQYYSRREWALDIVRQTSAPEQSFNNWMERDIEFARIVCQQAQSLGLSTLVVDGQRDLAQNTALVEKFLGFSHPGHAESRQLFSSSSV